MSSKQWKDKLLSSSLPLEFEVAKLLVSKGFSVSSDFTYSRNDAGVNKDFSVDLHATAYLPFSNPNKITASLELLIECKYRNPKVTQWLFFPDPNKPDFSPITLGQTIHLVDEFSPYSVRKDAVFDFEATLPCCYKGAEVNTNNSSVYDTEIKHGLAQLQYAIPRLIVDQIMHNVLGNSEDNKPFIFCSVLLTTAEIFIANKNMTIEEVEKASNLTDIAVKAPYLLLYSDYGPDFGLHCAQECQSLKNLDQLEQIKILESKRQNSEEEAYSISYPSFIGLSLAQATRYELCRYFTQLLVCSYAQFPQLIDKIKRVATQAMRTRREI